MAARKRKKRKGLFPKLILVAFVIYTAVTLISTQIKISRLEQETDSLDSDIAAETMKKAQLEQALSAEVDEEYMKEEAQKQGYAAPNERVFVDVSGS